MPVRHSTAGFSLIEAVVAVGVLALACLAAGGTLHVVLRAEVAGGQRREAARLLDAECARLEALPFYRRAAGPGERPISLLAEVFPHARPGTDAAPGGYVGGPGAAVFVTEVAVERHVLRRTATFVRETETASVTVSAAEVSGWAVWEAALPPALVVDLCLELVGPRGHVTVRHLVVHALRPRPDGELALLTTLDSMAAAGHLLRGAGVVARGAVS